MQPAPVSGAWRTSLWAGAGGRAGRARTPGPRIRATLLAVALACAGCGADRAGEADGAAGRDTAGVPDTAAAPDPVARLLDRPAPGEAAADSALETVRRAAELLSAGRPRAADDSLAAATAVLAPAGDWIRLARARAAAAAGDTLRVRRMLARLDSVPSRRWAWSIAVTARDSAGDPRGAAEAAERWAGRAGTEAERSRALLAAGRRYREAGAPDRARRTLRRSAESASRDGAALEAAEALADLGGLSSGAELAVGRTLAAHGEWWRARRWLGRYVESAPSPSAALDSVRLEYGRTLLYSGRHGDAIRAFRTVREARPELAPEALLMEARARMWQGGEEDGVRRLREVVRRHPEDPAAGEALSELAEHAEDEGRREAARRYWVRASEHAGSSGEAERRLLRGAVMAYAAADHASAAALLRRRGRLRGDSEIRQRAVYWTGLAERAAGRARRAESLFRAALHLDRFAYYGTRSAQILARPLLPADVPDGPRTTAEIDGELRNAVVRLRTAKAVDLDGAVETETRRLEAHFGRYDAGRYALAEAMNAGGFPLWGVRVARAIEHDRRRIDLRLLRALYPFPHREAVRSASRGRGLSPFLVAGLIRQESLFQPEIESYAGAIGLMQIMPATGLDLARDHGIAGYRTPHLRRPALNLRLGTAYLTEMLARFGGEPAYALAAYNAGPHRMSRWIRRPFARDVDVFVEEIPFRQTRHYVKAVLGHARAYAALYGCRDFEPCVGREASLALGGGGASEVAQPVGR